MSHTMYMTSYCRMLLEEPVKEIEVERFTEEHVWIEGKRAARNTDSWEIFETYEEAAQTLLGWAEERVVHAEKELKMMLARKNKLLTNLKKEVINAN